MSPEARELLAFAAWAWSVFWLVALDLYGGVLLRRIRGRLSLPADPLD